MSPFPPLPLQRWLRTTLWALPLASGVAFAQTAPDANALFTWAERTYPTLFPGTPANQTFPPYTFRSYSGGHYIAVANGRVYVIGPITANQLHDFGPLTQYTCVVTPTATGCPGATGGDAVLNEVKDLLQKQDALWASSMPKGAAISTYTDACYLTDGRNNFEFQAAAADPQYPVSEAHLVGAQRINAKVLDVRHITLSDGSSRREIDVMYDRKHTDGTTNKDIKGTLISGNSQGVHGDCTHPQNSTSLRFLGNQRLANIAISRRVIETHNFNITTGAATTQTVFRGLGFFIRDYRKQFTYAVVTGPGPSTTSNGQTLAFSLKLVAPRVLRDDPAMAGKRGHYTNWLDDDVFRLCRSTTSTAPNAALADCTGVGAQGYSYGTTWSRNTSPTTTAAVADANFSNLGLGGEYTIALYNDEGWKTINGHAAKTPVATYKVTQNGQPYTFASLASGSEATGRMPYFDGLFGAALYSSMLFGILNQSNGGGGVEFVTSSYRAPSPPDGATFVPRQYWHYHEGPLATNAATAYYPGNRYNNYTYMRAGDNRFSQHIPIKDSSISRIGYMELATEFVDRDGHSLIHLKAYNTP